MICQRTGYCCINLWVAVVIPEKGGKFGVYGKPEGVQCPNLSFDEEGSASCRVHNEPWFVTTPCHRYQNSYEDVDYINKREKPCMLGPMAQQRKNLVTLGVRTPAEELERFADFEVPELEQTPQVQRIVTAAALAEELIPADELEEHAEKLRRKS